MSRPLKVMLVAAEASGDALGAGLARALASCFAQTYRPIEVLVYDDASVPDVERVVNEFLADTPGRRRLGEGARRHAEEKLGWKRYVDELSQCLNPWLGTGGGES